MELRMSTAEYPPIRYEMTVNIVKCPYEMIDLILDTFAFSKSLARTAASENVDFDNISQTLAPATDPAIDALNS